MAQSRNKQQGAEFTPTLMAERLESLKAGIFCGVLCLVQWLILVQWQPLATLWELLLSVGIAGFSGFLFGVTYRYVVRHDQNPHLKSGAVGAFALVRGLSQAESLLASQQWVLAALIVGQNLLMLTIVRWCLDKAMSRRWIQCFPMDVPAVAMNSTVVKTADVPMEASAE